MSTTKTDELIQNVYQFRSLLKYIGERYPKILNEWKLGTWAGEAQYPQDRSSNHQESNLNGNYTDK